MNSEIDKHVAKAHEQVATRNSQVAVERVGKVESSLSEKIRHLENIVVNMHSEIEQLKQKYNLLLTKNFNGGSTSGD